MNRCNVIYFPIVAIAIKEPVYTNYASNDSLCVWYGLWGSNAPILKAFLRVKMWF